MIYLAPNAPEPHYPAPWHLKGQGFLVYYKFSAAWVEKNADLEEFLQGKFEGDIGSLMLVDYKESPVGPYKELLLIPGKFKFGRESFHSISRIYVSTQASVENGIYNWGIPKELADFQWIKKENGWEEITVSANGKKILKAQFSTWGIKLPVTTAFTPISLIQEHYSGFLNTKPSGFGMGKWAKLQSLQIDSLRFPDVGMVRPIAAMKVEDFSLKFPEPKRVDILL